MGRTTCVGMVKRGRVDVTSFRRQRLRIWGGAIERTISLMIHLRVKSNRTLCRAATAETLLQIRRW
jgi:hypothetical protein